ncbi:hypothetical protein BDB01DRAFT_902122 [Pilobolus umbonatus]|nr:hypothetical protein BDB01DRAFT_902122 [Pilobolus umbonatus]
MKHHLIPTGFLFLLVCLFITRSSATHHINKRQVSILDEYNTDDTSLFKADISMNEDIEDENRLFEIMQGVVDDEEELDQQDDSIDEDIEGEAELILGGELDGLITDYKKDTLGEVMNVQEDTETEVNDTLDAADDTQNEVENIVGEVEDVAGDKIKEGEDTVEIAVDEESIANEDAIVKGSNDIEDEEEDAIGGSNMIDDDDDLIGASNNIIDDDEDAIEEDADGIEEDEDSIEEDEEDIAGEEDDQDMNLDFKNNESTEPFDMNEIYGEINKNSEYSSLEEDELLDQANNEEEEEYTEEKIVSPIVPSVKEDVLPWNSNTKVDSKMPHGETDISSDLDTPNQSGIDFVNVFFFVTVLFVVYTIASKRGMIKSNLMDPNRMKKSKDYLPIHNKLSRNYKHCNE